MMERTSAINVKACRGKKLNGDEDQNSHKQNKNITCNSIFVVMIEIGHQQHENMGKNKNRTQSQARVRQHGR
jgi:hypothetical protein